MPETRFTGAYGAENPAGQSNLHQMSRGFITVDGVQRALDTVHSSSVTDEEKLEYKNQVYEALVLGMGGVSEGSRLQIVNLFGMQDDSGVSISA